MVRGRVLLIEDDFGTQIAMRRLLMGAGHGVVPTNTVAGAISLLGRSGFRHIVLDLVLEDGDGLDVLRHVRDRGLDSRVVVITGAVDAARLAAVREHRPELVLIKPIRFSELLAFFEDHPHAPRPDE